MKTWMMAGATVATLAGCATPDGQVTVPENGAFVPFRQVLAETAGRPFECGAYDASSDSCETIGVNRVRGTRVTSTAAFVVAADGGTPVTGTGTGRFRIRDGEVCGDLGETDIAIEGLQSPEANRIFSDALSMIYQTLGPICVRYYRAPGEGYISEVTDRSGAVVEDGRQAIRFFDVQKPLRPTAF